jgi:phosphatidylinositol-3-phosphatase
MSIAISPSSAGVDAGLSQQFTAAVIGNSNTGVHWLVNNIQDGDSTVGKISASGLYQAPLCQPPAQVTVSTQSISDATKSASAVVTITPTSATTGLHCTGRIPHSNHVVLVIEENHRYADVYPSGMPWLVGEGNTYGFTTNYHADASGSLLDYLWLSSGSGETAYGCTGGGCSAVVPSDNIFRQLNNAGLSWKVYAEDLPSAGYMGTSSAAYVKRHNPAPWYSDVINSLDEQKKMVPFTEFAADLAANKLPNYSVIVPNLNNDAHNGTLGQADTWLRTNVAPLLDHPYFQPGGDGLLIVTFDECDAAAGGACGGETERVYTAVIGPNITRGVKSGTSYKHENTLRTILDSLGVVHYPGASNTATDMLDFFH